MQRGRIGRHLGLWKDALLDAWGPDWADRSPAPRAITDVVADGTVIG